MTEKMTKVETKVPFLNECSPFDFLNQVIPNAQPVVLKSVCKNWPLVTAARDADTTAASELKSFYNGRPAGASFGPSTISGRFFYNDDATELNFEKRQANISEVLDQILDQTSLATPSSMYVGSASLKGYFPGLREKNNLDNYFDLLSLEKDTLLESIWIGNRTIASCHYDAPHNLACCVAGRRRFTLFPPDQVSNLYPGPLEPTPGGQAISMVNFHNPDFKKHPRFKSAIAAGQIADLEPGDALYIPSMWWHHVEALEAFNILINYWWSTFPKVRGQAMNVLHHAILSIRDRPEQEKQAWKHLFDHYIFGEDTHAGEHLAEAARGILGTIDDKTARQMRAQLLQKLNR